MSIQAIISNSSEVDDQQAVLPGDSVKLGAQIGKLSHSRINKSQKELANGSSGDLIDTSPSYISIHQADAKATESDQERTPYHANSEHNVEAPCLENENQVFGRHLASSAQMIFVWGSNASGQLGLKDGNLGCFEVPRSFEFHQRVQHVSCGHDHSAIVTFAKQLYMMGSNRKGQLGLGEPSDIEKCTVPTLVQSLVHLQVVKVSCGTAHTLAIGKEITGDKRNIVYAWGDNSQGQAGVPSVDTIVEPLEVSFEEASIEKISAGGEHSFFWDTTNWKVFACGEARQGQLGLGRCHETVAPPKLVESLSQERIVDVSAGDHHTLVINYDGKVLSSGSNVSGQLGLGHTETQHEFKRISELQNVLQVAAGEHSAAIDCDGRLFRWGQGVKGIYLAPLKIASPRPTFIEQITMGSGFGVVKNKLGEIFTYGLNEAGQLGLGDNQSRSTLNSLVQLNQQGVVKAMAAGSNFAIALVDTRTGNLDSVNMLQQHESAPQPKQVSDINNDRTSCTEFNEVQKTEMFAIMSERREERRYADSGRFDDRSLHLIKAAQGYHSVTSAQDLSGAANSDLGTIQTAQEARLAQAIKHESSFQDSQQMVESSKNLHMLDISQREKTSVRQVDFSTAPYTISPFNGGQRVPLRTDSTRHNSNERGIRDRLYNVSERVEPQIQVLDQSLSEQYQLKSSFAQNLQANYEPQQPHNDALQINQYHGIENMIPRNPVRRSLSPSRRGNHRQCPSFSINAPNQFRSKSTLNMPSSRRQLQTQNQSNSSMENTGQFQSSFAQKMYEQQRFSSGRGAGDSNRTRFQQPHSSEQTNLPNTYAGYNGGANNTYAGRIGQESSTVSEQGEMQTLELTHPGAFNSTQNSNLTTSLEYQNPQYRSRFEAPLYRNLRGSTSAIEEDLRESRYTLESNDVDQNSEWKNQVVSSRREYNHRQPIDQSAQYCHQPTSRDGSNRPSRVQSFVNQVQSQPQPVAFTRVDTADQQTFTPEDVRMQHQIYVMGRHPPKTSHFDPQTGSIPNQTHETESDEDTQRVQKMPPPHSRDNAHMRRQAPFCCHHQASESRTFDSRVRPSQHHENYRKSSCGCPNQRYATAQSSIQVAPVEMTQLSHSANLKPPKPTSGSIGRARSHSRCPACRQEEQQNSSFDHHQHHRAALHHQCDGINQAKCFGSYPTTPLNVSNYMGANDPLLASHTTTTVQQSRISTELSKNPSRKHLNDKKLKKKYKKLKQSTSRQQMENVAEKEKLKLRIHELQTMLQHRDMNERQHDLQQSEGYQALVYKYSSEISVLQEHVCKLERTVVARESQLKVVNKDISYQRERAEKLIPELENLRQENEGLTQETKKLKTELEQLRLSETEKDRTVKLLSERLESKTKTCDDAEISLRHLSKTLDDLRTNFDGAKSHADSVMGDNDQLHNENKTLKGNIEVYEKQIENLRSFIDELEANNKELVRFIDNKNMAQANDYKTRVAQLLSKDRGYQSNNSACLRAPSFADDTELQHRASNQHNRSTCTDNVFANSKSHSPMPRHVTSTDQQCLKPEIYQSYDRPFQSHASQIIPVSSLEQQLRVETHKTNHLSPDPRDLQMKVQQDFMTQQHCVRRKSPRKISFEGGSRARISQLQAAAEVTTSLSPRAASNSHTRFNHMVQREKREFIEARQSLPNVITQVHRERERESPTRNYLVTKAGQLMQKAFLYRQMASNEASDPRDRLNGVKRQRTSDAPGIAKFTSRSVSPGVLVLRRSSVVSRRSVRSSHKSVSAHNRSQAISQNRSVEDRSQGGHFASQDSLQVQYQKVTSGLSYKNDSHNLQSRLPDIRQVLQSSPGNRGRMQRREANQGATEVTLQDCRAVGDNTSEEAETKTVTVFPKVTSAMMRSQLENISMTLAELKRSRLSLNSGIENYANNQGT